jgi:hypothetical protein
VLLLFVEEKCAATDGRKLSALLPANALLIPPRFVSVQSTNSMSAQSIPNLNTLLSSRGGGRGRGRGRGRGGFRGYHGEDPDAKDRIVQRTDDDAADARMSAVSSRYLDDPFAEAFAHDRLTRRYPIINRGPF